MFKKNIYDLIADTSEEEQQQECVYLIKYKQPKTMLKKNIYDLIAESKKNIYDIIADTSEDEQQQECVYKCYVCGVILTESNSSALSRIPSYNHHCSICKAIFSTFTHARDRAIKEGKTPDFTFKDIRALYRQSCPVFPELQLKFGRGVLTRNSATIDAVIHNKGHCLGNLIYMSSKANSIKQDADSDILLQVAEYVKNLKPTIFPDEISAPAPPPNTNPIPDGYKRCIKCHCEKSKNHFNNRRSTKDGKKSTCKSCCYILRTQLQNGERKPRPRHHHQILEGDVKWCWACRQYISIVNFGKGKRGFKEYDYMCKSCNAVEALYQNAKARSKIHNREFSITKQQIRYLASKTLNCPVLGYRLKYGHDKMSYLSASLDRIDNEKGYIPENIHIISSRANAIKHDCTWNEIYQVGMWVKQQEEISKENKEQVNF